MKKSIFLFIIQLGCFCLQSQVFKWATTDTWSGYQNKSTYIAKDRNSNIFIAGEYGGGNSISSYGLFFAKYDSLGNKVWEHDFSNGGGIITGLCTDSISNIFLSLRSNGLTINSVTYSGQSGRTFFMKFDPNGNLIWLKQSKAFVVFDRVNTLGNLIITGTFHDTLKLNNSITLISQSNYSVPYLAQCDLNGNYFWGIQDDGGDQITLGTSGDFFTYGGVMGTTVLGKGQQQIILNSNNGNYYFAKYDYLGNLAWVHQLATRLKMAIDDYNNLYLHGNLLWTTTFDTHTLSSNPNTGQDAVFVKYDQSGNCLWAKRLAGSGTDWGCGIACRDNKIYISGSFDADFDMIDTVLHPNGNTRLFVAEYDTSGTFQWVKTSAGAGGARGRAIVTGSNNDLYITGDMGGGQVTFDNHSVTNQSGAFLCKLSEDHLNSVEQGPTQKEAMLLYPNPVQNSFTIHYSSPVADGPISIRITSAMGQTTYTESISTLAGELTKTIDLGKQAPGIYFVEVIAGGERTVRKIVLE